MRAIVLAAVILATPQAARADARALAEAVRPTPKAPVVALTLPPRAAEDAALRRAGIVRTAIESRLTDDAAGAVGFLCGREPGAGRTGAAAARGVDPSGRFLGARLSLAFR
jgi:hypothetical protein